MKNKITQLANQLMQKKWRICTAESCTGGLIAKSFTDLAGSSDWFERGFVTYSNQAKIDMLGVGEKTLAEFGAVSEQVASQMVAGALQHSNAQIAVAVTGIAGPGGGSPVKPVGTVWIGYAFGTELITELKVYSGDREEIRQLICQRAIDQLLLLTA